MAPHASRACRVCGRMTTDWTCGRNPLCTSHDGNRDPWDCQCPVPLNLSHIGECMRCRRPYFGDRS